MFENILDQWFGSEYPALLRRAGAELVGTYALVRVGCGAIIVNALTGTLTYLGSQLPLGQHLIEYGNNLYQV